MKRILSIISLCAMFVTVHAQDTLYLDAEGLILKNKTLAQEYAVITNDESSKLDRVAFYSMNNELKQISEYLKFEKKPKNRIMHGKTEYKYAGTSQDSMICYYNRGLHKGGCNYFYPDGKLKMECSYSEGLMNGVLMQYYPDGALQRKELYKKGICTNSNYYSDKGELLGPDPLYITPQINIGYEAFIREVGSTMIPPIEAMKREGSWKMYVEIVIDANGKLETVRSIQTDNQLLIPSIPIQVEKVAKRFSYMPATMDKQPVKGSIICPLTFHSLKSDPSPITNKNFK